MFSLNQNNSTKTIITSPSFSITSSFSPSSTSSNSPSSTSTSSSTRLSMTPNKRLFMDAFDATISFDSNSNSNNNDDNENKRKKRRKNWDDFEAVSNPIVSIVVEATHTIDFDEQSKNSDDDDNSQEEEEEEEQSEFSDSDASSDMDHDATTTSTTTMTSNTTTSTTTTVDNREQLLLATTSEEKAHFQQVWLSSPVNSNSIISNSMNSSSGGVGGDCGFFDLNRWRTVNFMPLPLIYRAIAVEMHKCYSESRKQHQEQEQKPQSSPSWMSVNASAEIPVKQCDMSRFLRVFHSNSSMYADYTPDLGQQQQQQQQQTPPTLLSMASMYGQHEILEYLIQMKARVNTTYKTYRTPLHYCARLGHDKCMRLLLDNGADYTAETEMGNRVIHVAAAFGHLSCVKMLVEHGENVNINYTTNGTTPLQCCIPGDHVHVLRWLVENGADPMVGRFDHEAIIKALATNTLSNHNLQRQLLPIHVASQYNAVRCLQYLIDQCGIDVNLRDEKKRTPLHIACSVGADKVIDVLLKKAETDVSLRDYLGARPFHHLFTRDDAQNSMKLIRRSKNASMSLSRIAKTSERFGRTNIAKMAQRVLRSE